MAFRPVKHYIVLGTDVHVLGGKFVDVLLPDRSRGPFGTQVLLRGEWP